MAAKRNKDSKAAVWIVLFVILLIIMSLIFTTWIVFRAQKKLLNVPAVKIAIQSEDGGGIKNVSATFAIRTDDKTLQGMNKRELAAEIGEAMREIDYNELSENNGSDYVKAVVKEELCRKYGDSIDDVYISDFINDVRIPSKDSESAKTDSEVNKMLEGFGERK